MAEIVNSTTAADQDSLTAEVPALTKNPKCGCVPSEWVNYV